MNNGNTIKANLLGMPFGTATNKLRKMLLFDCAKRLGEDVCYRCKSRIEKIEDFSIEHTVSWQFSPNPLETFFDLSTIAYSHLICNISHGKINPLTGYGPTKGISHPERKRIVQPDGTLWCNKGNHFQDVKHFGNDNHNEVGYKSICNPCRKERYKLGLSR